MQALKGHAKIAGLFAVGLLSFSISGCSTDAIHGTYFGTAGDTVLVLEQGGYCRYTDEYSADEGVQIDADDECSWSLSGTSLTLIGVSRHGSLFGQVGNGGEISIPDQYKWRGEIYTKK